MAERDGKPMVLMRPGIGPDTPCACGCGATFRMFDEDGRERRFIKGHYLKWLTRKFYEAGGRIKP